MTTTTRTPNDRPCAHGVPRDEICRKCINAGLDMDAAEELAFDAAKERGASDAEAFVAGEIAADEAHARRRVAEASPKVPDPFPATVLCAWCGGSGVLTTGESCAECAGSGEV